MLGILDPGNFSRFECCCYGSVFVQNKNETQNFMKKKTVQIQCSHTPENNEVLNGITDPFPYAIAKQLHKIDAMNCFRISKVSKNGLCVGPFYSLFPRERETGLTNEMRKNKCNVSHHFICFLFVCLLI